MSSRVWSGSVVQSYANLQNFISESDAISQVLSRKDKPCTRTFNPLNPNLALRWKVCQVTTAPFRYLVAIVLEIISGAAWCVGAKAVRKSSKDSARFFEIGFNVYSQEPTQLFRIKNSINDHNEEGQIVANTAPIPPDSITDPKMKKRTFSHGVKFNNNNGICRGISEWFMYLYLNTKDQFTDSRAHMRALGKQFVSGGGYEAALLQSINAKKGKVLGLKAGIQRPHEVEKELHKFPTTNWRSNKRDMVQHLKNLPAGAYIIGVPRHATAYVKINDNLGFFFDSNEGIVEINGPTQAEEFYELISETHRRIGDFASSALNRFNTIDIMPFIKR